MSDRDEIRITVVLAPIIRFCSTLSAYGYGVLSVVIITLLALLGIVALPLMNKPFVQYLLEMFVALGVSTLFSDALLHLIPLVCLLNLTILHNNGESYRMFLYQGTRSALPRRGRRVARH